MNAGTLLIVTKEIVTLLETQQILLPSGEFNQAQLDTVSENLELGLAIETILKVHGLDVPDKVDRVLQLLPLLAALVQ